MALPFKSYLQQPSTYKGGKSKSEIEGDHQKIYKLSSNENPIGASPKALAAIQQQLFKVSEYPDRTDDRLRVALARFYRGALTSDQLITTNSGVACLELIIRGFMDEGSTCIYSNPAFGPYWEFPKKLGGQAIDIPLKGIHFELDVEGILNAISPTTRLVFVTNPNNPTGTYHPKHLVDQLMAHLPDHVVLVYDEVYYQFPEATDYTTALPYVQAGKNVIAVNSFSKAYGLAGLRVGYAYTTPEIARYLQQLRRPFMINALSFEAAIAALEDQEFIERTVQLIHQEKSYLYRQLATLGIKYWPTQANFILIQPPIPNLAFESAMLEYGIMVRPIHNFGNNDAVRVSIGDREANRAYVKALQSILK